MAWREQLNAVRASFRGVPFHTLDADLRVGRRNVPHEYPLRDDPFVDDLGRRAREFTVECYVLGEDYLAQRNALWKALEAPGPGELIHPRWGALWVSVRDAASIKETPREGGMARFTIPFVQAGQNVLPNELPDTTAQVESAANAVDDAAGAAYAEVADVSGPQVLAESAIDALKADLDGLLNIAKQATSIESLADMVRGITATAGTLAALVRTPVNLVQGLMSLHQQFIAGVLQPISALAEFRLVFGKNARRSSGQQPESTRSRLTINDNARADLQRATALSQQARLLAVAISDGAVQTSSQAVELRNALLAQIDTELETNDPDANTAQALGKLRTAVIRDVGARAELLRQRSSFQNRAVLPALVVAHRVYQDARRADELVERNAVRNPLFVPAGELETLL